MTIPAQPATNASVVVIGIVRQYALHTLDSKVSSMPLSFLKLMVLISSLQGLTPRLNATPGQRPAAGQWRDRNMKNSASRSETCPSIEQVRPESQWMRSERTPRCVNDLHTRRQSTNIGPRHPDCHKGRDCASPSRKPIDTVGAHTKVCQRSSHQKAIHEHRSTTFELSSSQRPGRTLEPQRERAGYNVNQ